MRRVAWLLGVSLLAAGCSSHIEGPPTPAPSPASTVPDDLPNGMTLAVAASGPADRGVAVPFGLYTHCGLDNAVIDFGGTLWDVAGLGEGDQRLPAGLGDPNDFGRIALTGSNTALYVSEAGVQLQLVAHEGPKVVMVCY